jgi:hypothetical protein
VAQDVVFVVHLGYAAHANIAVVFGLVHFGPVARTFRLSCIGAKASLVVAFFDKAIPMLHKGTSGGIKSNTDFSFLSLAEVTV